MISNLGSWSRFGPPRYISEITSGRKFKVSKQLDVAKVYVTRSHGPIFKA